MVELFLKEKYCYLVLLVFDVLLCLARAYSFVGGGTSGICSAHLIYIKINNPY
jgi:hypothetical protein